MSDKGRTAWNELHKKWVQEDTRYPGCARFVDYLIEKFPDGPPVPIEAHKEIAALQAENTMARNALEEFTIAIEHSNRMSREVKEVIAEQAAEIMRLKMEITTLQDQ